MAVFGSDPSQTPIVTVGNGLGVGNVGTETQPVAHSVVAVTVRAGESAGITGVCQPVKRVIAVHNRRGLQAAPAAGRHKRISGTGVAARVVVPRRAHDGVTAGQPNKKAGLVAGYPGIGR